MAVNIHLRSEAVFVYEESESILHNEFSKNEEQILFSHRITW